MNPSRNARLISVCFAAAMSVTALILTAVTWVKMHDSLQTMQTVMKLRIEWEKTLSLIKDAETGQRGFILTGDEEFLIPFDRAKQSITEQLSKIRELSGSVASAEVEIAAVEELIRQSMEVMSETVVVRKREGLESALQIVKTKNSKRLMDSVRSRLAHLTQEQQEFMNNHTRVMHVDLRWGYVSAISTGAMALLGGVVSLLLLREAQYRARREERLLVEKLRAEESNEQKSNFLATMSHEIRTPMNAILGFGELLEGEVKSEKEKRYVQSILVGARSLLQLINDILDLSKIEAGMMQLKEEPLDVRDIGAFVQQLFAQQATEKGVSLRVHVADNVPHSLVLDGVRMRQILINIVGNALKFTDSGKVEIRFYANENVPGYSNRVHLCVDVEDTGRGIPVEHQKDIFNPFIQVQDASGRPVGRGTGLGLTIVKRLAELVNGRITLISEVGKGTCFKFEFPGVNVSARLPVSHGVKEVEINFNELRASKILVADDNETNRELLKGIFEDTHHRLKFAEDGAQALRSIAEDRPDLVLMDVRMPGVNGRQALQMIRAKKEYSLLPVVAVTASSLNSQERQLRDIFDGYLRKPLSRVELYNEISQFIPRIDAQITPSTFIAGADDSLSPELQKLWQELVIKLRDLEAQVWPNVRDGMLMSEVRSFADNLEKLASTSKCGVLELYARRLVKDIESFSLSALEDGLQSFPKCISEIEHRSQLGSP